MGAWCALHVCTLSLIAPVDSPACAACAPLQPSKSEKEPIRKLYELYHKLKGALAVHGTAEARV